ncbi:MAG TPA: hypothetical protein VF767_09360 [Bryobacteraceae bacterium]
MIRDITPDFTNGTVDFDLFNGSSQSLSAWRVTITFYAADGTIAGTHFESEEYPDVSDSPLKPGATKHYAWTLRKLKGVWPAKISVDVSAFMLADNTAYGDEAGIRQFVRDRDNELRIARQIVQLLETVQASANPRATIKQELQKLAPDEAVPLPERELRYILNNSDEILQSGRPEGLQELLNYMRGRVSRAERNVQIQIQGGGKP